MMEVVNNLPDTFTKMAPTRNRESLEDICTRLESLYGKFGLSDEDNAFVEMAYSKYPYLKKAISTIGFFGLKQLNYNTTNIKNALVNKMDISDETKVFKMLKNYNINIGSFYSANELKKIFGSIYNKLGINKTAKGSDIHNYYNCVSMKKKINGEVVSGYRVDSILLVIK